LVDCGRKSTFRGIVTILYDLASPLYTVAALAVLFGIFYSAKTFFDAKMAQLKQQNTDTSMGDGAEA
tara:strand:+ start:277 stop:477 length:201 start_codon:yes stop_codon:yes gene_type:complete